MPVCRRTPILPPKPTTPQTHKAAPNGSQVVVRQPQWSERTTGGRLDRRLPPCHRRRRRHRPSAAERPCPPPPTRCRPCKCQRRPTMASLLATTPTRPPASVQLPALGPALPLAGSGSRTRSSVWGRPTRRPMAAAAAKAKHPAAGHSAREQGQKSARFDLPWSDGSMRQPLAPQVGLGRQFAPRGRLRRGFGPPN